MRSWLLLLAVISQLALAEAQMVVASGWARLVPPVSPNSAAYFSLTNNTDQPRTLVSVSSPAAETAEMHSVVHQDGAMAMKPLPKVTIGPGESVQFSPGGNHVMLIGLKKPLQLDSKIVLTLIFKNGESLEVPLEVKRSEGERKPHQHHDHHH